MKYIAFLLYIIAWDGAILVGATYLTFIQGRSGWWWLFALVLMSASFKPRHFGIQELPKVEE